jgi:uncharacterized protein
MAGLSRRAFLKGGAAVGGALVLGPRKVLAAGGEAPGPALLEQFDYGSVRLLDGPLREQFDRNHAFFLAMDEDALLKPFRQRAGLPAPGPDLGGWYNFSPKFDPPRNLTGFIPGHSFGQYLSGLARAYAATGSAPTRAKVRRLVRGFAPTVTAAFYRDYALPCYTFDKINCGLIDAHEFAGDPIALEVLNRATDAALPWLPPHAQTRPEQAARPHPNVAFTWDESYTLPENLYLAWRRGAGARFRRLAGRFLQDRDYFDPLAAGENVLPGLHAYSHVNALCSACQAYLATGSAKHLRAAKNGFACVRTTQSFATGGWGPNETFQRPGGGGLGRSLTTTHASFETPCGSYGHFKLCRYLLRITGDSRYGDSMEQVLYNTILGAKPILADGSSFYYSDYNDSAVKVYHGDKWPCCSGTFPQITADYGISSYFRSKAGIWVNLFAPSRVSWSQAGTACVLTQRTDYPRVPTTSLELRMERPEAFAVALRIPAWAGPGTRIAVNGRAAEGTPEPGSFLTLERTWRDGDRIEVEFDVPLRLEAVDPQHPRTLALLRGPVALFAVGDAPLGATRAQLLAARPAGGASADWRAGTGSGPVTLRPFAAIRDERYRLYHEVES